ncbi:hypothetical protein CWC27_15505, partial [Pseudoalteromonas sp. S4491]
SALKISDLEQLNNEIFALLSTRFYCLKIDHLIKRIGITLPLTYHLHLCILHNYFWLLCPLCR